MSQNRNFISALIAAVATFVVLPFTFYQFYGVLKYSDSVSFFYVLLIPLFVVCVAVFVVETIALVKLAKGKEVNGIYNIVRMVLDALFAVLALVIIIKEIADIGTINGEILLSLLGSLGVILFAAGATGTSFGFTLYGTLKK